MLLINWHIQIVKCIHSIHNTTAGRRVAVQQTNYNVCDKCQRMKIKSGIVPMAVKRYASADGHFGPFP